MSMWRKVAELLARRRRPSEAPNVRFEVRRYRVMKWDGDPPAEGEHKLPIEVIEVDCDTGTRRVLRPVNGVLTEVEDDSSQGDVRDQ